MPEIELLLEYKGWVVGGAFVLLFTLEHLRPAANAGLQPVGRIIKNLSFWPINIGLSLLVILPVSYFAAQHVLWDRPEWWPGILGLVLDILILDIFLYFWHRALHVFRLLWRFHRVHHLDEHLDTTSAVRFHFGEILLATIVRALVIIVFALPFSAVVFFETLVLICTLFHHSNIALPSRFEARLSKTIVTPSIHWVHHHAIRTDTDSNYGTIFSFWDNLFNTKSASKRFVDMKIGVENLKDKNFMRLVLAPFSRK